MDGGLSASNLREALKSGVDWIVAGSAIFQAPDPAGMVQLMNNILQEPILS
jgi:ribulose-phosphate 3-epimerase